MTPEERREQRQRIRENPTFDDLKALWPHDMRGNIIVCRQKYDAITSEAGLNTQTRDPDSGGFVKIHLKATPQEIYAGAERYLSQHREDYKLSKYVKRLQQFLNGGYWVE